MAELFDKNQRIRSAFLIGVQTAHMLSGEGAELLAELRELVELLGLDIVGSALVGLREPAPAFLLGPHWRIEVWLKPTVTDPAASSVTKAVADLGFSAPEQVRTGTSYRILGRINAAQAEKILSKLLANPVIHETRLEQK